MRKTIVMRTGGKQVFSLFPPSDIASHPERLRAVGAGLVNRIRSLVAGVEADRDAALVVSDWTIFDHPLFLDQLETLNERVICSLTGVP